MSDEAQINEAAVDVDPDIVVAAQKREAASKGNAPSPEERFIDALLTERSYYVSRGEDDRVAEVDEQLRLRGVEPPADATGEGKRTATRGGRGRGRTAKA